METVRELKLTMAQKVVHLLTSRTMAVACFGVVDDDDEVFSLLLVIDDFLVEARERPEMVLVDDLRRCRSAAFALGDTSVSAWVNGQQDILAGA